MEYEAFDLRSYQGKQITLSYDGNAEFESHVIVERTVPAPAVKSGDGTSFGRSPTAHGAKLYGCIELFGEEFEEKCFFCPFHPTAEPFDQHL